MSHSYGRSLLFLFDASGGGAVEGPARAARDREWSGEGDDEDVPGRELSR